MPLLTVLKNCFPAKAKIIQGVKPTPPTDPKAATISIASSTSIDKGLATPTVTEICSIPVTQRALTVPSKHTYHVDDAFPTPKIQGGDEVLIKTCAVGLNPIDWKSVDWNFCLPQFPWVTGREMSGVVAQVGENVTEFKEGDRVWTGTYYRDIRSGCFQEYAIAPRHTIKSIPSNLTFEVAACLGVCGLTASMTLWRWLEVPIFKSAQAIPSDLEREFLLVWGGASITGQFLIQLAAYSGLEVITVASSRTKDLLLGLGAKHVITRDGKSNEAIVAEIRAIGGDDIYKGADIVGPETAVHCMSALSSKRSVRFAPLSFLPKNTVAPRNMNVLDIEMKWFILDRSSEQYAVALNDLLEKGIVKVPQLEILQGGLDMIEEGLKMQKKGDRAGKKLIVSF